MKSRFRMSRAGASGISRDTLRGSDRTNRSQGLAVHLARSSLLYRKPAAKRFTLRAVKSPCSSKMRTSSLLSRTPTKMPSSHRSSTLLAASSSLAHDRARRQRMKASRAAPLVPCASQKPSIHQVHVHNVLSPVKLEDISSVRRQDQGAHLVLNSLDTGIGQSITTAVVPRTC